MHDRQISEFEASLVYRVSYRTARATQRNPVSKNNTLLAVGKIKEKYLVQGISEYAKRLSRYCKLEIVEVADEKTPDKAGDAVEAQIKETEVRRLLKYIREGDYVVALAIQGKMLDSIELSKLVENLGIQGARISKRDPTV